MFRQTIRRPSSPAYQLFMMSLCLYAIGVLIAQRVVDFSPEARTIFDYADILVCLLFFVDFVVSLARAPDRRRYLLTWGWLDLLSSIPAIDIARWGRAARILRILRVLRGFRATRIIAALILDRRAENSALAGMLVAVLLMVFCSVAILHFETKGEAETAAVEREATGSGTFAPALPPALAGEAGHAGKVAEDERSNRIETAGDALWWAFTTITTVGYGDKYPDTPEGRIIAAILMCAGVGLFGTFSALLAAWLVGSEVHAEGNVHAEQIKALSNEIAALRESIERMRSGGTA